jgi:hypothetical protein
MSTGLRRLRALSIATLAAALLSACASSPVGGDWQVLEGANFALYTDGNLEEAQQLYRELEEFRAAMTWFTSLQKAKLGKVRLMVFKSGTDALPYLIEKEIGAWASVTATGSLGVAKLGGTYKPIDRQTLKRDLVKLWLDDARVRSPNWYREGLSELVSAFQIEGGKVQIGGLPPIELSQYAALIADEKEGRTPGALLSEEPGRYVKEDRARMWLAVHYLMVANRERQDELAAYFRAWAKGTPSAEAFVAAFGQTPADFYRLEVGRYGTRALAARQFNLEGASPDPRQRAANDEEIEKLVAEVDRAVQRLR